MVTIVNFYEAMDLQGCNYIMSKSNKKTNSLVVVGVKFKTKSS